jgi:Protein of unknown function (DUF4232)
MARVGAIVVLVAMLMGAVAGCGGGSGHTTTVRRTVTIPFHSPVRRLSLAHRDPDSARVEAGRRLHSEAGCTRSPGGRVKAIELRSEGETCVRVSPHDLLLFVDTVRDPEPEPVEVSAGPYTSYAPSGGSTLIPAPVGTYLGPGLHRVETGADATAPLVLVLPEGCQVADTSPGESLCFAGHRPPCRSSDLAVHAGRGGAGAGTFYGHVLLVNRSARTCAVSGFPEVTPLDATGRPLGRPFPTSIHTKTIGGGDHPPTIDLEPGAAAVFGMNSGTAANYSRPACRPRKAATLRVTIPGAGGPPLSLPSGLEICTKGADVSVGRIE